MLASGTTKLYGTWIPRSTKHAPKGVTKIVSFGQQMVWKWLHDEFEENFFGGEQRRLYDSVTEPEGILAVKPLKDSTALSLIFREKNSLKGLMDMGSNLFRSKGGLLEFLGMDLITVIILVTSI
jgi:hypothetical protein